MWLLVGTLPTENTANGFISCHGMTKLHAHYI
jgi:hypothetical protein